MIQRALVSSPRCDNHEPNSTIPNLVILSACHLVILSSCHPVILSLLQDRQIVVRDLKNDAGHRGGVVVAEALVRPATMQRSSGVFDNFVSNGRVPFLPVGSAGGPHRLGRVVMAVVVV